MLIRFPYFGRAFIPTGARCSQQHLEHKLKIDHMVQYTNQLDYILQLCEFWCYLLQFYAHEHAVVYLQCLLGTHNKFQTCTSMHTGMLYVRKNTPMKNQNFNRLERGSTVTI